jgi:hypothetical protein
MAFPGPFATVYRNEAGEPIGWSDERSYGPEPSDPYEDEDRYGAADAAAEDQYDHWYEQGESDGEDGVDPQNLAGESAAAKQGYADGYKSASDPYGEDES